MTIKKKKIKQAIVRMEREMSAERADIEVKVEFMALDLASLQSTKEFTLAFHERNLPLHILINNAAVAWVPLGMYLSCMYIIASEASFLVCSMARIFAVYIGIFPAIMP